MQLLLPLQLFFKPVLKKRQALALRALVSSWSNFCEYSKKTNYSVNTAPTQKTSHSHADYLSGGSIVALIASMMMVGISFGAIAPLVAAILEQRGFSEYYTGSVAAILAVAIAVSSPSVGRLVERYGTRKVNTAGLLGQAVGFAAIGVALATSEHALFAIRFFIGLAATMTFIAAEVALLRGIRGELRGRIMSAYGSALGFGFMSGVFAGDWLYERAGLWCFGVVALFALLITPIAWLGLRGEFGDPGVAESQQDTSMRHSTAPTLDLKAIVLPLYCAAVFGALDMAISGTYPVEGQRLGLMRSESLNLVGLMALGLVASQPLAGWLADKLGARAVLKSVALLGVGCSAAAGWLSQHLIAGDLSLLSAAFVGIGMAVGGSYPVSLKLLGDRVHRSLLPSANAKFSATYGYAALLGPLLASVGIDVMERLDLLGWAVPGLCGFSLLLLGGVVACDARAVP